MRNVELLWNLGFSDECQVLIVERRGDLLAIIDEVKGKGERINFYAEKLKELAGRKGYVYDRSHLPRDAYIPSLYAGTSVKEFLDRDGFIIEPWIEIKRGARAA